MQQISNILNADSYKFSHFALFPANTQAQFSYVAARVTNQTMVPLGYSAWIKQNLMVPITQSDIDQAADIAAKHGDPFNRADWEYILEKYDGYLPVKISAIPEGMPVESETPLVVVESTDERLFWLPSYLETSLQRATWYSSTIATNDRNNWLMLKKIYELGSDNMGMLEFALHDFGARGVACEEQAAIGGLAHLVYFRGTDNMSAIVHGRKYYACDMAGFSVPATEHSIQCAYGRDNQHAYLKRVLDVYAKPGAIVSLVIDGYDVYREAKLLCTKFKDQIIESGAKVVFRPDSGDMFEVVPRILQIQETYFGYTTNSKGKKVINNVGIIQGDGIDSTTLAQLAGLVDSLGYAPECVIYGSGGGLLQKVNRDTYRFAQKTSAIKVDGVWIETVKDPITDPGKKSKGGVLTDHRHVVYYHNGRMLFTDTLDNIRQRAKA
jgi:nicotinamide phosphoribosyltransferase